MELWGTAVVLLTTTDQLLCYSPQRPKAHDNSNETQLFCTMISMLPADRGVLHNAITTVKPWQIIEVNFATPFRALQCSALWPTATS